jgi:hypothetical protein
MSEPKTDAEKRSCDRDDGARAVIEVVTSGLEGHYSRNLIIGTLSSSTYRRLRRRKSTKA